MTVSFTTMTTICQSLPDLFDEPSPVIAPKEVNKPGSANPHLVAGARVIPEWAIDILSGVSMSVSGESYHLKLNCGILPKEDYKFVNDILSNIGGKWKGSKKAHVFPYDPTPLVEAVLASGRVPAKNPLDFFPTPKAVVVEILEALDVWSIEAHKNLPEPDQLVFAPNLRILEPQGGGGGIISVLLERYPLMSGKVDTVEFNPLNAARLRTLDGVGEVFEGDFLSWEPTYKDDEDYYGITVMNPPFSYKGNSSVYIDHIMHAWEIMKARKPSKELFLVAITPASWLENPSTAKQFAFRDFVAINSMDCSPLVRFDENAFKESGTSIKTVAICIHHEPRRPASMREEWLLEHFMLHADNESDLTKDRAKVVEDILATSDTDERLEITGRFVSLVERKFMAILSRCFPQTPTFLSSVADELLAS